MVRVFKNEPLKNRHTFGIDAVAGSLIEYESIDDLRALSSSGDLNDAVVLGGGSNMLFTTSNVDRPILHCLMNRIEFLPEDTDGIVELRAEAGAKLDSVVAASVERGLWGLENLSMIPGEVGGAAVQNVGAYGVEACDVIRSVETFDTTTGEPRLFSVNELDYGYRHSMFKCSENAGRYIVTAVTFTLSAIPRPVMKYSALKQAAELLGHKPTSREIRDIICSIRNSKLPNPTETGSAGSFFKNPVTDAATAKRIAATEGLTFDETPFHTLPGGMVKLSAAWLIDRAGGKRLNYGGASVWPLQPLVIVNTYGKATGSDITRLECMIINAVSERFGVTLIPEVTHI